MLREARLQAAFGQLVEPLQQGLDRAVVVDQPAGGLVADAGDAGDVVGGVTAQRLEVDQLRGLEPVALADLVGTVDERVGDAAPGHQRVDGVAHQLQAVEVAADNGDVEAALLRDPGQRADHVVGLVAVDLVDRDVERVEHLLRALDLRPQVVRHLAPAGLVLGVLDRPEGGLADVEGRGGIVGPVGEHDRQHRGEAVNGVGHLARGSAHRREREEGAVDQAVGVDEHQTAASGAGHD